MTIRNPNTTAQEVDARPWRRYSDSSTNDSILDTLTMTVPAGETKKFNAEFGYNAEDHSVIECGPLLRRQGNVDEDRRSLRIGQVKGGRAAVKPHAGAIGAASDSPTGLIGAVPDGA